MDQIDRVNVCFDHPGDFLEIGGRTEWSVNGFIPLGSELGIAVHLTDDFQATGFYIRGALLFSDRCNGHSVVVADVQPHPVTVKYDRLVDLWDIQWCPGIVDSVDTPNSRIKARVDADGRIQEMLASDLRTLEDEILNQDLYPVQLGTPTAWYLTKPLIRAERNG